MLRVTRQGERNGKKMIKNIYIKHGVLSMGHLLAIYSLYPFLWSLLEKIQIFLPIYSFQYQSDISSLLAGPGLFLLGVFYFRKKNITHRILGMLYLAVSFSWLYNLIHVLLSF